jgi:hypothetical protein
MDKWERETYVSGLKEVKHPLAKTPALGGLPREWVPLYRYKGKYYIYSPSEAGNICRMIITDSTIVYWGMEGPTPEPIFQALKVKPNTWYVRSGAFYINSKDSRLTIHLIDPVNKIAVWEDASQPIGTRYNLYVAREKARNFDMVVNYCKENKEMEFMFDKINYPLLLKAH